MAFSYDHQDRIFPLIADNNIFPSKMSSYMPLFPHQIGEITNSPSSLFYSIAETTSNGNSSMAMAKHQSEISSVKQDSSFEWPSRSEAQTCLSNKQCKNTKQSRNRKQKRSCSGDVKEKEEKKLKNNDAKESSSKDPPAGYIHVRARRGQATDSHSLAERVRREKISERMKMLQEIVPGCDKVTGKAHMLDEIINYVQSLQSQVEFLSMKLASFSPMLYDFGVELDECMNQTDNEKIFSSNMTQTENANNLNPRVAIESEAYQMIDHSSTVLLQGQGPTTFSQDVGSLMVQVAAQRQSLLNELGFVNMCTFQ